MGIMMICVALICLVFIISFWACNGDLRNAGVPTFVIGTIILFVGVIVGSVNPNAEYYVSKQFEVDAIVCNHIDYYDIHIKNEDNFYDDMKLDIMPGDVKTPTLKIYKTKDDGIHFIQTKNVLVIPRDMEKADLFIE